MDEEGLLQCRCGAKFTQWSAMYLCPVCCYYLPNSKDASVLYAHRKHVVQQRRAHLTWLRETLASVVHEQSSLCLRRILGAEGMMRDATRDMLEWRVLRLLSTFDVSDCDLQLYFCPADDMPAHLWHDRYNDASCVALRIPTVPAFHASSLALRVPLGIWKQYVLVHLDDWSLWQMRAVCRQFHDVAREQFTLRAQLRFAHFGATPAALLSQYWEHFEYSDRVNHHIQKYGSIDALQRRRKYLRAQDTMSVLEQSVQAAFIQDNLNSINNTLLLDLPLFRIDHNKLNLTIHCRFQMPTVEMLAAVFDGRDAVCAWNSRIFLSRCTSLLLLAHRDVTRRHLHEHQQVVRHLPPPFVQCFFAFIVNAQPAVGDLLVCVVETTQRYKGYAMVQFVVSCLARIFEMRGAHWLSTVGLPSIAWSSLEASMEYYVVLDEAGIYFYQSLQQVYRNHSSSRIEAQQMSPPENVVRRGFFVVPNKRQRKQEGSPGNIL